MSEEWVNVASRDEVPEGGTLLVDVGGDEVCLYNLDGNIFATEDVCTHGQASLSEGFIEGDCIECPLHQGLFDIRTGKAMKAPATVDLRVFAVDVQNGEIRVLAKPR